MVKRLLSSLLPRSWCPPRAGANSVNANVLAPVLTNSGTLVNEMVIDREVSE